MAFRNLWQSWVIRSSGRVVILLALSLSAQAKKAEFRRAQAIAKSDPLEAEAIYERFLRDAGSSKLRRAANYDLFYLRLRNGRLAEAFGQTKGMDLGKKYQSILADQFGLTLSQARVLTSHLRSICEQKAETAHVGEFLREENMPAAVWDFVLRVLLYCNAKERSRIFAEDIFQRNKVSRLETQLRLIAIREQLYSDPEKAEELLAITRAGVEEQYADDEQLQVQILLLEARISSLIGDYDRVIARCGELVSGIVTKQVKAMCDLLITYAFLKKGDATQAWDRISKVPVKPADIDGRLLRLITAVAAGFEKPEKLLVFKKRASYSYCARRLRELADAVIAQTMPRDGRKKNKS